MACRSSRARRGAAPATAWRGRAARRRHIAAWRTTAWLRRRSGGRHSPQWRQHCRCVIPTLPPLPHLPSASRRCHRCFVAPAFDCGSASRLAMKLMAISHSHRAQHWLRQAGIELTWSPPNFWQEEKVLSHLPDTCVMWNAHRASSTRCSSGSWRRGSPSPATTTAPSAAAPAACSVLAPDSAPCRCPPTLSQDQHGRQRTLDAGHSWRRRRRNHNCSASGGGRRIVLPAAAAAGLVC